MRGRNTLIALFLASTLYVQVYARLVHTFDKKVVLERKKTKTIMEKQGVENKKRSKTPVRLVDKNHENNISSTHKEVNSDSTFNKNRTVFTHNPSGSTTMMWYPDYRNAPYETSFESKTVDPQATNYEKEEGFTQNYAQIYGFYEHLNTYFFPYQPYYKHPTFYWMYEEKNDRKVWEDFTTWTRSVFTAKRNKPYRFKYHSALLHDGTKVSVPFDERFRNAWTALYLSDPSSIAAFSYYAMAMLPQEKLLMDKYEYPMENRKQGIINSGKNLLLPYAEKFEQMRNDRDRMACTLATTYLKFDDVVKYVKERFDEYKTAKNAYGKLLGGFIGHTVYEKILLHHKDYKATALGISELKTIDQEFLKGYDDLSNDLIIFIAASKAVTVPADIKTQAKAAAHIYAGAAFEGILFYSLKWNGVKESDTSNRIIDYVMPVSIIFNENGKHILRNCVLHKSIEGIYWISSDEKEAEKS